MVNITHYMDSPFWIDSSCWAWYVWLMSWWRTSVAYSRTGRIIEA